MSTVIERKPRSAGILLGLTMLWVFEPVAAAGAASLWVGTSDVSRPVWIDEEYHGLAPVRVDDLPAGEHRVLVGARPGSAEWVRPWETRVTLKEDADERLEAPPLQLLRIFSSGRSVEVAIDARPVGWTPLRLLVPADRSLEIRVGTEIPMLYRAGSPAESTLVVNGPPEPPVRPAVEEGSRLGLYLPLGAVAFGVLGVWSRQVADRAYEDYLETVDRGEMRSRYDRAARYDDIAVGCWVAAEILLAASVWTWLRGGRVESRPAGPLRLGLGDDGDLRVGWSVPLGAPPAPPRGEGR